MNTKYCALSKEQWEATIKQLHSSVYWLLLYKERGDEKLEEYFDFLMVKIGGLNSLLGHPPKMVDVMMLLEVARMELKKGDSFDFKLYRRAILDAESAIDKL